MNYKFQTRDSEFLRGIIFLETRNYVVINYEFDTGECTFSRGKFETQLPSESPIFSLVFLTREYNFPKFYAPKFLDKRVISVLEEKILVPAIRKLVFKDK